MNLIFQKMFNLKPIIPLLTCAPSVDIEAYGDILVINAKPFNRDFSLLDYVDYTRQFDQTMMYKNKMILVGGCSVNVINIDTKVSVTLPKQKHARAVIYDNKLIYDVMEFDLEKFEVVSKPSVVTNSIKITGMPCSLPDVFTYVKHNDWIIDRINDKLTFKLHDQLIHEQAVKNNHGSHHGIYIRHPFVFVEESTNPFATKTVILMFKLLDNRVEFIKSYPHVDDITFYKDDDEYCRIGDGCVSKFHDGIFTKLYTFTGDTRRIVNGKYIQDGDKFIQIDPFKVISSQFRPVCLTTIHGKSCYLSRTHVYIEDTKTLIKTNLFDRRIEDRYPFTQTVHIGEIGTNLIVVDNKVYRWPQLSLMEEFESFYHYPNTNIYYVEFKHEDKGSGYYEIV